MNEDEETPLTMSREDRYELAWSKPMRGAGQGFRYLRCGSRKALPAAGDRSPGKWLVGSCGRRLL